MRGEYIGLGVSASSFMEGKRFTNTFKIDEYLNAVIFNKTPEVSVDEISGDDAKFEKIMLALRTVYGLNKSEYNKEFGCDFDKEYKDVLNEKAQFLINTKDNVRIKDEYLYVQNDIILAFMK